MSTPLVANPVDAATLADELARFRVVDPGRLAELVAQCPPCGGAELADFLVRRGALNAFQAERALAGGARWLVLGPYRLVREAAAGGTFGPVYVATHREKPGEFRLRTFPLRSLWRARQAGLIARSLASPPHPAVVPLVDADSDNGLHYLAWPHVGGMPLSDGVAPGRPMPVAEVVGLLVHLGNALHACHLLRVAHGTITPQAIVLGADQTPLLLEQGAGAILAENLAGNESLLDTLSAAVALETVLEYAAPEFVSRPGPPTPAADQYALGGVAYFALTGRPPYPAASRGEQLAAKLAGPPRPIAEVNPAVPPALAAVIDRMLSPNPADRFPTLAEVRNRLAVLDACREAGTAPHAAADTLLLTPNARRLRGERDDPPAPGSHARLVSTPALSSFATRPLTPRPSPALPPPNSPQSPPSPPRPASPPTEDPAMAKLADPAATGAGDPPKPVKKSDPRKTVGSPFHYHVETPANPSTGLQPALPEAPPEPGEPPLTDSVLWKKLKRNILFWRAATEVVQVSVFGPPTLTPGQAAKVSVYVHQPEASDSVHTLCRAFHHDAVLVGTGYVTREVARDEQVAVHFSVANAGVAKSMQDMVWRGQPMRLVFDLHVPWESPAGPAPGVVSVGIDSVRVGRVEFRLLVTPRKS